MTRKSAKFLFFALNIFRHGNLCFTPITENASLLGDIPIDRISQLAVWIHDTKDQFKDIPVHGLLVPTQPDVRRGQVTAKRLHSIAFLAFTHPEPQRPAEPQKQAGTGFVIKDFPQTVHARQRVLVLRVSKWQATGSGFVGVLAYIFAADMLLGATFESINILSWLVEIWERSDTLQSFKGQGLVWADLKTSLQRRQYRRSLVDCDHCFGSAAVRRR
ncbi:MAG: hypothetical protein Q9175_001992 [Cornicularia normoerica]